MKSTTKPTSSRTSLSEGVRRVNFNRGDLALAAVGAVSMALSAPPVNLWPFGLLVWVPLAIVAASGDVCRAGLMGWIQGTVAQGAVLAGVPAALREAGGTSWWLSWGLAALLALFEGARFGVIALLAAKGIRNGWPIVLSFPVSLVAVELVYPMFFPWSTWLFFQSVPVLLQGAELGGAPALSLWAGLLDASLAAAWQERARRPLLVRYLLVVPVVTLTIVVLGGAARMRVVTERAAGAPEARVGVVQGDVANVRGESRDPTLLYREASLAVLAEQKVDLLIWPETAISFPVSSEELPKFLVDRVFREASPPSTPPRIDVPLLTGMVIDRKPTESPAHVHRVNRDGTWLEEKAKRFNSAVLATPDGRLRGIYDKRDLVPLGEYIPWEDRWTQLRRLLPSAGGFSPGSSSAPIVWEGRSILVLICYEDVISERVREAVEQGEPDLLVNLTSDAWFGQSRVPSLHLALAKLRAIEHRRFLVHATNTGLTAVIDPAGRTVAQLPPDRVASMVASVHWMRTRTVYEAAGRVPALTVAAIAAMLVLRRRPNKHGPTTPTHSLKSVCATAFRST